MEDGLAVYQRPSDPARPVVCFDEVSQQLWLDARDPLPPTLEQPRRMDDEDERAGPVNLFRTGEPLAGKRCVTVTERRPKRACAHQINALVDDRYPGGERIVLVLDNLNPHRPAALDETVFPAEAKRLTDTLELHDTPKHGSWLNRAELDLSVLRRQCLDRRVPDRATLERESAAWQTRRNVAGGTIDWRFTTEDARIELQRLYPSFRE